VPSAAAHGSVSPLVAVAEIDGRGVTLALRWTIGADEAAELREQLDVDGSGGLEGRERAILGEVWAERARRAVRVDVGTSHLPLATVRAPDVEIEARSIVVTSMVRAEYPFWRGGEPSIRVDTGDPRHRTEVIVTRRFDPQTVWVRALPCAHWL